MIPDVKKLYQMNLQINFSNYAKDIRSYFMYEHMNKNWYNKKGILPKGYAEVYKIANINAYDIKSGHTNDMTRFILHVTPTKHGVVIYSERYHSDGDLANRWLEASRYGYRFLFFIKNDCDTFAYEPHLIERASARFMDRIISATEEYHGEQRIAYEPEW